MMDGGVCPAWLARKDPFILCRRMLENLHGFLFIRFGMVLCRVSRVVRLEHAEGSCFGLSE